LRLPRDLSGHDLIRLLRRHGYTSTRQVGSHIRLQSTIRGHPHQITVPDHRSLRVERLVQSCRMANYLKIERSDVEQELFEK